MGIDPAPFWANLYLYHYEETFITNLISVDKIRARKFFNASIFIDDECKTFLDLDISVVDNIFVYKLFDKRGDFPFTIVRMPDLSGNIPSYVFYGSIMSEVLRITCCMLLLSDFIH